MYGQDVFEDWTSYSGAQNYFLKSTVKTDASRNVYNAGATISSLNDYDLIITKYDRDGIELWTETYDGSGGDDAAVDIYIDDNENVYVAGTSLDPNTNIYKCLLLKYNASGVLLWDEEYAAQNSLYNVATAITGDGIDVYIGGGTYSLQTETDYLALAMVLIVLQI